MARKSTQQPAVDKTDDGINHAALAEAHQALDQQSRTIALIDKQYGVDMHYNLDAYIARARQNAAESAMRMIEIGLLLIQIRERESREVFGEALERIGIQPRFAQRTMQAAIRLQDRPQIQQLGVTKALELLSEDDEALDALESGGTVAGLAIDDIDGMTAREVRTALRRERRERAEEQEAADEIIARKDKKINALQSERKQLKRSETRTQVADLLADIDAAAVEVASLLQQLRNGVSAVRAAYADAGENVDEDVAARIEQNQQLAVAQLQQLAEELGE